MRSTGGTAEAIKADLTDSDQVPGLLEFTKSRFGNLAILILSAGVPLLAAALVETGEKTVRRHLRGQHSRELSVVEVWSADGGQQGRVIAFSTP